jgi:hypothetical protein
MAAWGDGCDSRTRTLSSPKRHRHREREKRHRRGHHKDETIEGRPMSPLSVRPLGGGPGCLVMLAASIIASVVLTVLLNLFLR